ncbi:MAG TPA: hypothetical protein VNA16_06055, partial [Abditibacteriaceae bacterium]|nr:hypothetical protein [Abditibacteriaceae bacterium]
MGRVTAVFDSQAQAESAVNDLRSRGVSDAQLSFVSGHGGGGAGAGAGDGGDAAEGAGKGLLAGAGVGALFGLGAALIPGVGPFITAGWLAASLGTAAGGAAAGAIVGATTGAVAGALARSGYSNEEAEYYGGAVEKGGVLVAVDAHGSATDDQVRSLLV